MPARVWPIVKRSQVVKRADALVIVNWANVSWLRTGVIPMGIAPMEINASKGNVFPRHLIARDQAVPVRQGEAPEKPVATSLKAATRINIPVMMASAFPVPGNAMTTTIVPVLRMRRTVRSRNPFVEMVTAGQMRPARIAQMIVAHVPSKKKAAKRARKRAAETRIAARAIATPMRAIVGAILDA